MHDIFISYSHKDSRIATTVLSILEQNGIKCWIDYRDAEVGESYAASIVRAIKGCKYFVVLMSSSSGASGHVLNEVNSAVKACVTIIPFKIDNAEISDGMEYYLGKTHWLEALTPPLEEHIRKLVDIIHQYDTKGAPSPIAPAPSVMAAQPVARSTFAKNECRMMRFEDLLAIGYTAAGIAMQLVENDYITCNGIGEENEGTAEQWEGYLQDNSDTFRYLVNGENKIVGDWSIVALTDEAFDMAMKGQLLEKDIDISTTTMICFPDVYNGYLLAISLLPEYRNMKNYNLIIDSFLKQLEEYSENGIFFRAWCMNVFGKEIEGLVRSLGMKYVCDNAVFGKIYHCDFMPLPNVPIFKKYPKLVENYANL